MGKIAAIRWGAFIISVFAVPLTLWHSLIAPFLLVLAVVWCVAAATSYLSQHRIDALSLGVSMISFGMFVGIFFVPLWIIEQKAHTPDDFMKLAEGYASRGQLFGDRAKAQAYYLKAAEAGNVEAQARFGEALYYGHYGTKNRDEGLKWLKLAASNGHQRSSSEILSIEGK